MSFSRAVVKRFNEPKDKSAPAPGHYNVPEVEKTVGMVKFQYCSERFKSSESLKSDGTADSKDFAVPSGPPRSCSKRKLNFHEKAKSAEKSRTGNAYSKEKEALEQEIRKLLRQCQDREQELLLTKEEIQKLQNKISVSTKDKHQLESHVASLEKSVSSLQKRIDSMEAMKTKDKSVKDIEKDFKEAKNALQICKQECDNKEMQRVTMEADLHVARSRVIALEEANKMLEKLNEDIEKHDNGVTEQVNRLQDVTTQLRSENRALQDQLESSRQLVEQVQDLVHEQFPSVVANLMGECREKTQIVYDAANKLDEKINIADEKVTKFSNIFIELQKDKASLIKDISLLEERVEDLRRERDTFASDKADLSQQVAKHEEDLVSSKEESADLAKKLEALQEDFDKTVSSHQLQIETLNNDYKQLVNNKENQESRNRELVKEVDCLKKSSNKLQEKLSHVNYENDAMKASLEQQNCLNTSLRTESDELNGELLRLQDEHDAQRLKIEQQATETKRLQKELDESEKECETSKSRCTILEASLSQANSKLAELDEDMSSMKADVMNMETKHEAKLAEFTRRILEMQKKLNQRDAELKATKSDLSEALKEIQDSTKKDEALQRLELEKQSIEEALAGVTAELEEIKLEDKQTCDDKGELIQELEKWRCAYEELEEKTKPFANQLNAYSAEKAMLLNETNAAHAEVTQLGRKYAELLGHQNHKQKIKHIVKLKEQNIELKEENHKLRLQVSSLQKQVVTIRKPRFDPSKAFQHHKENADPNAAS